MSDSFLAWASHAVHGDTGGLMMDVRRQASDILASRNGVDGD